MTRTGTGAITAVSSTAAAKASVENTTVTVFGISTGSANITVKTLEDANYTASAAAVCAVTVRVPVKPLASNSWQTIRETADAGIAANYWAAGDTKPITIDGKVGETTFNKLAIDAFILGINHNAEKEGANKIHFQIGKIGGVNVGLCDAKYEQEISAAGWFAMNTSPTNDGGWRSSYMRTTLLGNNGQAPTAAPAGSFIAALPSDLKAVMVPVTKYTNNIGNANYASSITATEDYVWLPVWYEISGSSNEWEGGYVTNHTKRYDYYKAGNRAAAYKHTATTDGAKYLLRSPSIGSKDVFCGVCPISGNDYMQNGFLADKSEAITPCFAV